MGKEVQYHDEKVPIDNNMTAAEFKQQVGASEGDLFTYHDEEGNEKALNDDQTLESVPDGARVAMQPDGEQIYG
jgi:hypothetical protein